MPFFKRGRAPTNATPLSKQAAFLRNMHNTWRWNLLKFGVGAVAIIGPLLWFGSPALRISYTWNGNAHAPLYYECTYLNLLTGLEQFNFNHFPGHCPILIGIKLPVSTYFQQIIGGLS